MSFPRISMVWNGEAFEPERELWQHVANQHLVVGQQYWIVEQQERSKKSHSHYFATVQDGWENLPERFAGRFPNSEYLRKFALIRTGFCKETEFVFPNNESATLAAGQFKTLDEYSMVSVDGNIVTQWIAETQKQRDMGRERFQLSKQAVIDLIAGMLEITSAELADSSGKAA